MNFESMLNHFEWRGIPGCPGRYVLRGNNYRVDPRELAGKEAVAFRYPAGFTRDPIVVTLLEGGGLISYLKPGGSFVHTLNTTEGLQRKLKQLGIPFDWRELAGEPNQP